MQSVNDDMDELWRRAANEYPLNTGGADWDKVASRLGIPPEPPKRRDRRYLWLLLLLLVPVVCMHPFPLGLGTSGDAPATPGASASVQRTKPSGIPSNPAQSNVSRISTGKAGSGLPGSQPVSQPSAAGASVAKPDGVSTEMPANNGSTAAGSSSSSATQVIASTKPTGNRSQPKAVAFVAAPAAARHQNHRSATKIKIALAPTGRSNSVASAKTTKAGGKPQPAPAEGGDVPSPAGGEIRSAPNARQPQPVTNVGAATVVKGTQADSTALAQSKPTTAADTTAAPAVAKSPKKDRTPLRRFYAGAQGGIGITTVKRQRVQAPSYDLGVVLGYQFSRHLALEANVLWSRRNYYSHGKYLQNDLSYLPQYSYVHAVDGDCHMFEIPVTLHYRFRIREKGAWFVSGGLSSYLMKREEYGYDVKNYMTQYDAHYDTTLRNATRDWMSQLQLSAGYGFQLKRGYTLRLEPYAQLPLGRAGAGRLPLTSYGLRVALLKGLF